MENRIKLLHSEILEKCENLDSYEFEYYWEIWGVMWHPWFIEIKGKTQDFSLNDISFNDLNKLCDYGLIELIKEYSKDEMTDDFDRKKYRILKTVGNNG